MLKLPIYMFQLVTVRVDVWDQKLLHFITFRTDQKLLHSGPLVHLGTFITFTFKASTTL